MKLKVRKLGNVGQEGPSSLAIIVMGLILMLMGVLTYIRGEGEFSTFGAFMAVCGLLLALIPSLIVCVYSLNERIKIKRTKK